MYKMDNVNAQMRNDILRFSQPTNTTYLQFSNAFWMETLKVPHSNHEYVLKDRFL